MSSERANMKRRLGMGRSAAEPSSDSAASKQSAQYAQGIMPTLTNEPNLNVGTLTQSGCRNVLKADIKGPYKEVITEDITINRGGSGVKNSQLLYIVAAAALLFLVMRSR